MGGARSVAANLGVQFGLDFDRIREAQAGGLRGDIGLRLRLAIGATPGFDASGFYTLVVSRSAAKAGGEMANFLANAKSKPSEALEALAKFGGTATTTFNNSVRPIHGGGALRPLGTIVFLEAARTF